MPAALRNLRVRFLQSRGPEVVTGIAALFWLWNQPAELHRLSEYLMTKWHHSPGEMYGSLTVLTLKSSQIAHSCLYVRMPGLEWQTVNCYPPSSPWITHSSHWWNSRKEIRNSPTDCRRVSRLLCKLSVSSSFLTSEIASFLNCQNNMTWVEIQGWYLCFSYWFDVKLRKSYFCCSILNRI